MGEVFKLNHCYNMDCLPAMELFPDNYFDLAVVDPPYFSGPERRGFYGSKVSKIGVHRDYPVSPAWSKPEPEYFRELLRVCRRYIVWGCNYFDYQFATGRIVWDKCNGNSSFSDCEIAATDLFSSVRMFRYMWSGMMQGKSITEGGTMQGNKSLNEKRISLLLHGQCRCCWTLWSTRLTTGTTRSGAGTNRTGRHGQTYPPTMRFIWGADRPPGYRKAGALPTGGRKNTAGRPAGQERFSCPTPLL